MTLRQISTCWIMQNPLKKMKHMFLFDGGCVKLRVRVHPIFDPFLWWGESIKSRSYPGSKKKSIRHVIFSQKQSVFADISASLGFFWGFSSPSWPTEMVESEWPRLVSNFQKWKTARSAGESTPHFTQCRGKAQGTNAFFWFCGTKTWWHVWSQVDLMK